MWYIYSNKLCSALHKDRKEENIKKKESRGSSQISENTVGILWSLVLNLGEGNHIIIIILNTIQRWARLKFQQNNKTSKNRETV